MYFFTQLRGKETACILLLCWPLLIWILQYDCIFWITAIKFKNTIFFKLNYNIFQSQFFEVLVFLSNVCTHKNLSLPAHGPLKWECVMQYLVIYSELQVQPVSLMDWACHYFWSPRRKFFSFGEINS